MQVCGGYDRGSGQCGPVTYTLHTDTEGYYQLWLDRELSPVQVIAAAPERQPRARLVRVRRGQTVTADFALAKG